MSLTHGLAVSHSAGSAFPACGEARERFASDEPGERCNSDETEDGGERNAGLRTAREPAAARSLRGAGRTGRRRGAFGRRPWRARLTVCRVWIPAERPVVAAVGREDTSEAIAVGNILEVALDVGGGDCRPVDNEGRRGGRCVGAGAVRAPGADEGGVADEDVVLHGEVLRGGDRHAVSECACERVIVHYAGQADVAAIVVAEPGARANGYSDPMKSKPRWKYRREKKLT